MSEKSREQLLREFNDVPARKREIDGELLFLLAEAQKRIDPLIADGAYELVRAIPSESQLSGEDFDRARLLIEELISLHQAVREKLPSFSNG